MPGCRVEEEEALHEKNVLAALYCPALDALITSAEEGSIRIHWLNMRWGWGRVPACPQIRKLLNQANLPGHTVTASCTGQPHKVVLYC